jgi:hypothetical protein
MTFKPSIGRLLQYSLKGAQTPCSFAKVCAVFLDAMSLLQHYSVKWN